MAADTSVTKTDPLAWTEPLYILANLFDDAGAS